MARPTKGWTTVRTDPGGGWMFTGREGNWVHGNETPPLGAAEEDRGLSS